MPKTVLVVDDEEDLVDIIASRLEGQGYKTIRAFNGKAAVETVLSQKPDLTILDIMMPGMNGYEVLSRIRQSGIAQVQKMPVVMLTARGKDTDVFKGYKEGADYYITKPFKNETVLNIVNYLIGDLSLAERERLETML